MRGRLHPLQHHPGDATLPHRRRQVSKASLGFAVALTLGFGVVELIVGIWSGSLALVADASHMATDASALLLALVSQMLARRPPTRHHSYGHGRIEVFAGLVNSLIMSGLVGWIAWEAFSRLSEPHPVAGGSVALVALLGLAVNAGVAWSLSQGDDSLNTRAALVHVWGDLLGSLAALLAGLVIAMGGPLWVDPVLSLLVVMLLLRSTFMLLRQAYHLLMDHVPLQVDFDQVARDLLAQPSVLEVHNLHIWEIYSGQIALTAHLELERLEDWASLQSKMQTMLRERHGIDHATIQPEAHGGDHADHADHEPGQAH